LHVTSFSICIWRCGNARSAIEGEPADFVSQALIVQNKFPDRIWQLFTLPLTFQATCLIPLTLSDGCAYRLDRIGGCPQLMCGNMRHGCGLSGGVGRISGRAMQVSGGCHCMTGSNSGLGHRDFAAHPCPNLSDRVTRARV
jgi:hypothetical protein